jgi:hypothetical protein
MRRQSDIPDWGGRPSEEALEQIKERPESYVRAAQKHTLMMDEGRGALFAYPTEEGVIQTFFLPSKEVRAFLRDEGKAWLSWYKDEVRWEIRGYDPQTEAVVLTNHEDGPRCNVVSVGS